MRRSSIPYLWLWLLIWSRVATPILAAPPTPGTAEQVTTTLQEALPPTWPLHEVRVEDDVITVCLDIAPADLEANAGLGAEIVADAVRVALTTQTWRVLDVQSYDPLAGRCRALSDFVPSPTWTGPSPRPVTPATEPRPAAGNATQSLSGKTVYISAGHGWQWGPDYSSTSPVQWLTQRVIYQGFIEDHNNAEVITQYLIPYLENAGATVIPVRERDWNTQRSRADNDAGAPVYTESGTWTAYSGGYNDGTYRLATTVNGTATATATWILEAPADGNYALYAWVTSGSDRPTDARYTVRHASGSSTVFLSQRTYPETWRYLGTFPCYAGPVTITLDNGTGVAGAVVVADALRLGGGLFDDLTGIETLASWPPDKPWWETSTRYYAQWMGLDPADWSSYNDVVARPIFARWNYASSGDSSNSQAVFISWHTNGYDGTARGTVSYIYNDASTRTEGSVELQQAVHSELINDIHAGWDATWYDRGMLQANLGEVRALWDSNPAARMPGTLLEIAFHDNVDDANALKDPRFNQLTARAVYQGILHYFEAQDGTDLVELPEPPTHLRVENQGNGSVRVAWNPSPTDGVGLVGDAASAYNLYTSPDGFAWGGPIAVSGTEYILSGLTPGRTLYVRVTGTNAGGESFPTEVLGARVGEPAILIVNGFDKLSRYGLYADDDTLMGSSQRLWLERINSRDYAIHHGEAIPSHYAWDSASNEAVYDGLIALEDHALVDWILGEESTIGDGTLNETERTAIEAFLAGNNALLISGAELGWDMEAQGRDADFLHQVLYSAYIADDAETYAVTAVAGGAFDGLPDFTFDAPGEYDTDYPDVFAPYPGSGAGEALYYVGGTGGVAAVQFEQGCRRLLNLGFPIETIRPESRPLVMAAALDFLDVCFQTIDTSITQPQANGYYSNTPDFNGTATEKNITRVEVQVQRDGDNTFWNGSGWGAETWLTATGTLTWSYALPALADGPYHLRARAILTQPEATPAEVSFVYDGTPPLAPTPIEPQGTIMMWNPTLSWRAPDDDGSPLSYQVDLDGQMYQAAGLSHPVSLITGTHTWRVRAADAANNVGPWSSSLEFSIEANVTDLYLPLILRNYTTPTPTCTLLLDSGFETEEDWGYNQLAIRVTDIVYQGTYAARVGIPPDQPGQDVYSSISQTLALPGDILTASLSMQVYPVAEELSDDYHYVIVHDAEATSHIISTHTSDERAWQARTFDLGAFAGQRIILFIGARNDGDDDTAALYLDNVQVEICR